MLARGESGVKSIYSFFHRKKSDNSKEVAVAYEEFTQLCAVMSIERDEWIDILIKQTTQYDPNYVNFLQDLRVQMADYPELPDGVILSADEIKQVIKARQAHHAEIKLAINHYLESSQVDEFTKSNDTKQEIK